MKSFKEFLTESEKEHKMTLRFCCDIDENAEDRIEKLTQRYQKQYANMESAVAGLNETGNMLTALLGNNDDD